MAKQGNGWLAKQGWPGMGCQEGVGWLGGGWVARRGLGG
jgi:hypothetical protein